VAKLNANTTLVHPSTLEATAIAAGDEVPDWADGLVGDHLIEDEKPKRPARSRADKAES